MASTNLTPPDTLGHSAFAITAELSVVDFKGAATLTDYPTQQPLSGALLIPSIHVRKGLPWSFELGVRAGWVERSRMGVGTLELKWALMEGLVFVPDISIRGHVSKILNSRDFDLTAGGFDLGIGKQFAIAGMVTLTPYIGWDLSFVGASTNTVDFRPDRSLSQSDDPQAQFQDFGVFEPVLAASNTNNRFYVGLRFIGGVVIVGYEFSHTVVGSFNDPLAVVQSNNFTVGFDF